MEPRRQPPLPQPYPKDQFAHQPSMLESRAKLISLSHMPQYKINGRTRVPTKLQDDKHQGELVYNRIGTNQGSDQVNVDKTERQVHFQEQLNDSSIPSDDFPAHLYQGNVNLNAEENQATTNVHLKEKVPEEPNEMHKQERGYQFKPPAAAKYFLWDSTRQGKTIMLGPNQWAQGFLTVDKPCLKALCMQFYKLHLLATSSTLESTLEAGFLLAKRTPVADKWAWHVDRFDYGRVQNGQRVPCGQLKADALIHVMNEQVLEQAESVSVESFIRLFKLYLQDLTQSPVSSTVSFPAILSVQLIGDNDYALQCSFS